MNATSSLTTALRTLTVSIAMLALGTETHAATWSEALKCQQKLLKADARRTKCVERCARSYRAECAIKCEASFARSAEKPLTCIGTRLVRHVRVPADTLWVDTGVYTPQFGNLSITALGSWSYLPGGPKSAPSGTPNTENDARLVVPEARFGELIMNGSVFGPQRVGHPYPIQYDDVTPRRIRLAMNDIPWGYADNTGFIDVSVMVDGLTRAEVSVPANQWVDSKIFKGPGTYVVFTPIAGMWTNVVGGAAFGPAGYSGYVHPGTMLPDADLGALAATIGSTSYAIGSGITDFTPAPTLGSMHFGMNDVVGTLHDNAGAIAVAVHSGGFPVL